jgi:hypothetical protein
VKASAKQTPPPVSDGKKTKLLTPGTRVYLKTTTIGESLGIKPYRKNGGEAEVISASTDSKGEVYQVRLLRNGKCRTVRRSDLTVHRKQPKPRPEKAKRKRKR